MRRRKRGGDEADIKSNNPHPKGGEKQVWVKLPYLDPLRYYWKNCFANVSGMQERKLGAFGFSRIREWLLLPKSGDCNVWI